MAKGPTRETSSWTLDRIWKNTFFGQLGQALRAFNFDLTPVGKYSGSTSTTLTPGGSNIITNPWGVAAQGSPFSGGGGFTLRPGQSINLGTGQLSDPNLNANTAKRLNDLQNSMLAKDAGYSTAGRSTSRGQSSVLATLDQMYFGNVSSGKQTYGNSLDAIKSEGLKTTVRPTVLGAAASKGK